MRSDVIVRTFQLPAEVCAQTKITDNSRIFARCFSSLNLVTLIAERVHIKINNLSESFSKRRHHLKWQPRPTGGLEATFNCTSNNGKQQQPKWNEHRSVTGDRNYLAKDQ